MHLGTGGFLIPEGEHEGDLGGLDTVLHGIRPGIEQGGVAGEPGIDAVGVVGKDHVHAGVGQQLTLLSLHPRVVAAVVAVDGLVPEGCPRSQLIPQRIVVVTHGLGVLGGQLLHIHGVAAAGSADVPRPVEHGQGLIVLETAHVGVGEGHAAQAVGEDPGIGHDLMGIDEAVLRDHVGIGGLVVAVGRVLTRGAGGVVIVGLAGEMDADVGEDLRKLARCAVGIDLTLKSRGRTVGVQGGGLGHIVNEEQVVSRGDLAEGDLGVQVILQDGLARAHGGLGNGLLEGSLPCVDRHGHLDVVTVVGAELGLHAREGEGGIHADTHALIHVINDHALGGIVKLYLIEHILGLLTIAEGILHGLGKADAQLGLASLLLAVQVQKALGTRGEGIGPDTCVVAGVGDVEEVLACGLGIKGHPVGVAVHHGIEHLLGDGLGGHGRLIGALPRVQVQGGFGILLFPRRHGEAEGVEGILDACAVGEAFAYADGLSRTRTVLDRMLLLGGGGDREGQNSRQG